MGRQSAMMQKPYSVWPEDRDRPFVFATYEEAEAYARKSIKRLKGKYRVGIDYLHEPLAHCHIDWRDRVVVDLTPLGAELV